MVFALGCERRTGNRIVIGIIDKILLVANDVRGVAFAVLFGITGRIRIVFGMGDDANVVGERWLQIFKGPFIIRVADFLESLLRLRYRNVLRFGVQYIDFDLAFAD